MNSDIIIPLFGLALWFFTHFIDAKFHFLYPKTKKKLLRPDASFLRKKIVHNSEQIKYVVLITLWLGISLGIVLSDRGEFYVYLFYGIGIVGLLIYVASRMWPLFVDR